MTPACTAAPRRDACGRRDEGTTTAFAVILSTALLGCAGLVLDGGLALTARVHAVDLAQEAARAGAQELDLTAYRTTGTVTLNPAAAAAAARAYLAAAGATTQITTSQVTTTGGTVTVTVATDQPTRLLTLIGIGSLHVTGHATAAARPLPATGP